MEQSVGWLTDLLERRALPGLLALSILANLFQYRLMLQKHDAHLAMAMTLAPLTRELVALTELIREHFERANAGRRRRPRKPGDPPTGSHQVIPGG